MDENLAALRAALGPRAREHEPLAPRTTFRIGGPADLLVEAKQTAELVRIVQAARQFGVPFFILGNGSNVLVLDGGMRGLVVENHCTGYKLDPAACERAVLHAEGGASLPGMANRLSREGWSGLEWAIGVPGTIGGAVVGNAGAHGGCIADRLLRVVILDAAGEQRGLSKGELALDYRSSRFKGSRQEVILQVEMEMDRDDPEACIARMNRYSEHRRSTQPTDPSVGSIFKNPPGESAGKLIERAGLKGVRMGAVEVSPIHGNFFVNHGGARAADVLQLVELVRERVRAQLDVELELEIQVVGEP